MQLFNCTYELLSLVLLFNLALPSMWKDMFNSEVVPLDFNEMPAVRKSPKKQQKLLAVYKSK